MVLNCIVELYHSVLVECPLSLVLFDAFVGFMYENAVTAALFSYRVA